MDAWLTSIASREIEKLDVLPRQELLKELHQRSNPLTVSRLQAPQGCIALRLNKLNSRNNEPCAVNRPRLQFPLKVPCCSPLTLVRDLNVESDRTAGIPRRDGNLPIG